MIKYRFSAVIILSLWYCLSTNLFAQQISDIELSSITLKGNEEFSDTELRTVIHSKESPFWVWKFLDSFTPFGSAPVYFDSTAIPIDLIALKSFYSVNGYFSSKFFYSFNIDTISKDADLTYTIDEGKPYTYGKVNTRGISDLEPRILGYLKPYLEFPSGLRFTQDRLSSNLNNILSVLRNNGFMLASFDSTIIGVDSVKFKTDINIFFTIGHKYRFNKIILNKSGEGQNLVSDDLIKYVSNIKVKDVYDEEELYKSRLRLARTGLFNTVNLKSVVEDTSGYDVPLMISGDIGPLNEFAPEVFIDNEFNTSNLGVGLNYIRKNFFGDARKLTISTRFKLNDISQVRFSSQSAKDSTFQTQLDASMQLEQPFLFGRNTSGSLEAFIKNYNISSTVFDNYGGKILVGFDMPRYTFLNLLNPYFKLDILRFDVDYNNVNIPLTLEQSTTTAILGTETASTTANDIFFPSAGYNLNLIIELAAANNTSTGSGQVIQDSLGVPQTIEQDLGLYYKIESTFANYFSISRDNNTVLGIKLKIGYIQPFRGSQQLIPPNQTFFAGGANSIRGWRARQLVPENTINFIGLTKPVENNIRGGTFLLEGSIEERRKFNNDFGYAIFMDFGNTWNSYTEFNWKDIAVALGLGLRYYSPFAPFRIDFGWKFWDPFDEKTIFKKPFWKSFEFHFGLGEAF